MRGLEKNCMGRGHTDTHMDGHRDSMKESAKGRFFENILGTALLSIGKEV